MIPNISSSLIIRRSSPSILTSVPAYLLKSTLSPALTVGLIILPLSKYLPAPTATTSPSCGFSLAESGIKIPDAVFSSLSKRLTITLSCKGPEIIYNINIFFIL